MMDMCNNYKIATKSLHHKVYEYKRVGEYFAYMGYKCDSIAVY